jgi:hypothetical protein
LVEENGVPGENHRPSKQCTGVTTYTTTPGNETVNVGKIEHIFIVLVLPTKSVFKD